MDVCPFCTDPSFNLTSVFLSAEYQHVITLHLTCQDTVMASLPHAGVFSRKSVSLIVLHGSNDTSFLADKADAIKYIMLVRAIADDVGTAWCFCLHATVILRLGKFILRFYSC
jgi:hypothetical protein